MAASSVPSTARARIDFLDYLRIFAFSSVLVGHLFHQHITLLMADDTVHATPRFLLSAIFPFLQGGGAGVVVFFLVSGYIITHVLRTECAGEFLIQRFFRIYPLYLVAVLTQAYPFLREGTISGWHVLQQALLVGDVFDTPYALGGVEWTLRIEVMFYVFMAALRSLNVPYGYPRLFSGILFATTIALGLLAPLPSHVAFKGYISIYAPFLLLGVSFYLVEHKFIGRAHLVGLGLLVFYQYFSLISEFQKPSSPLHFAALAFLIFLISWSCRRSIVATPLVRFMSGLTYSVYLFHNWAYYLIQAYLAGRSISIVNAEFDALVVLVVLCLAATRLIERPGIQVGRLVLGLGRDLRLRVPIRDMVTAKVESPPRSRRAA